MTQHPDPASKPAPHDAADAAKAQLKLLLLLSTDWLHGDRAHQDEIVKLVAELQGP